MPEQALIMGVGSPVRGDQLGLLAVEWLQQQLRWCDVAINLHWLARERPGLSLLDDWKGMDRVVLIDAMQSPDHSATIARLVPDQLIAGAAHISSHSAGVAEAIKLASILDELPPRLAIFGINNSARQDSEAWLISLGEMVGAEFDGRVDFGLAKGMCP